MRPDLPFRQYSPAISFPETIAHGSGRALISVNLVRIEGPPGEPVQGDGDIIARLPLTVRLSETTMEFLVPAPRTPIPPGIGGIE